MTRQIFAVPPALFSPSKGETARRSRGDAFRGSSGGATARRTRRVRRDEQNSYPDVGTRVRVYVRFDSLRETPARPRPRRRRRGDVT